MDNHEYNDDALKNQNNANDEPPKEEIPLWLQGMEESQNDETKPIDAKSEQTGNWIRETEDINAESVGEDRSDSPDSASVFETEIGLGAFDETPQPGHTEGVPENGETMADEIADGIDDHEITEEFVVESLTEQPPYDDNDSDLEEFTPDEGFVDISQFGLDQQTGDAVEFIDDESLREGDLPEWLQEMIAESEQDSIEEADVGVEEELIIPAPSEESQDSSIQKDIPEEAFPEPEEVPTMDDEEAVEEKEVPETFLDEGLIMAEEDTAPVALYEEPQPAPLKEDLNQFEYFDTSKEQPPIDTPPLDEIADADQDWAPIGEESLVEAVSSGDEDAFTPVELPDIPDEAATIEEPYHDEEEALITEEAPSTTDMGVVDLVKAYIEQGQMEQAQPLIYEALDNAEMLAQLEVVLGEMAEQPATASSDVLETLGDIALKQNKPEAAFEAYAKALKIILENEGDSDEIS